MTITIEAQSVHLPQNDRWQEASLSYRKITKRIEEEEDGECESLCFLSFLHLYSVCFGSNYNWDQLLMFGHIDFSLPQEPSRVIPSQFLNSIQLFW